MSNLREETSPEEIIQETSPEEIIQETSPEEITQEILINDTLSEEILREEIHKTEIIHEEIKLESKRAHELYLIESNLRMHAQHDVQTRLWDLQYYLFLKDRHNGAVN